MNVLPSAPAYDQTQQQQLYPMQELTQLNAEDFSAQEDQRPAQRVVG